MLRFWFAFRRSVLVFIAGGAASLLGQFLALGIVGSAYSSEIESAAQFCAALVLIAAIIVFFRRYEALHPSHATVSRVSRR